MQLAKKIREKFNRYLDVVNRNKQVVEASYTAHLTSPLTAIQDCCSIPASMMEWVTLSLTNTHSHTKTYFSVFLFHTLYSLWLAQKSLQEVHSLCVNPPPTASTCTPLSIHCFILQPHAHTRTPVTPLFKHALITLGLVIAVFKSHHLLPWAVLALSNTWQHFSNFSIQKAHSCASSCSAAI